MLVIFGMMFFTLGAEMSMTMMGEKVGAKMTQSKNVLLIVCLSFLLGVMITISEPDLQVLATLVPSILNMTIIMAVAIGVGILLVLALLRILYSISLAKMLVFFYIIVFILASQVSPEFRAVTFDSGGFDFRDDFPSVRGRCFYHTDSTGRYNRGVDADVFP